MSRKTLVCLLFVIAFIQGIEARYGMKNPDPERKWSTLHDQNECDRPEVIARGGYLGFFPDSSFDAYSLAADVSIPGTVLYCSLQFSKDSEGFCASEINLKNITNIDEVDGKGRKTYTINGHEIQGWFGLDYPSDTIFNKIHLKQNIFSRVGVFDGVSIISPSHLALDADGKPKKNPSRIWINVQYDTFYKQHRISAENYVLDKLKGVPEFISSPEIGFLKSIAPKLAKTKAKLIFAFLEQNEYEPSSKETYGSLTKKLSKIKSFAYGILVPKEYIWPVDEKRYLQSATNLVQDAHKLGLAVYASGFANDNYLSYNYSYDPAREYLQFVDNSQFSVDGILTDFPSTASAAIGCLNPSESASRAIKSLIISHNGASGDFPGASDLAYHKAIEDGADIIDCSVQLSKDGTAFCLDRSDLSKTTTASTRFIDRSTRVSEIQETDGIFSFDLTWSEIQSLAPKLLPQHICPLL